MRMICRTREVSKFQRVRSKYLSSIVPRWLQLSVLLAVAFSGLFASAQKTASTNAVRQAKLAQITGQLRIGTEFFLNRTDTEASVDKQFQLMHATGLTLVRIFIIWDDVERVPGVWNFEGYDWIYDAAAKNGMKVVATLCPEDPPGWADTTPFYHNRVNLNDPTNRAAAAIYLKKVVERYR